MPRLNLCLLMIIFLLACPSGLNAQTDNSRREGSSADPAISPVYDYYEWSNEIPDDCPAERSDDFRKVVFTGRYANYTGADTWYMQSAPDGNMYSPWTDGYIEGFSTNSNIWSRSVGHARVMGDDPLNLKFENLGRMWAGGTNYYPCVSLSVDSTFYIGTYKAFNDQGYFNGLRYSSDPEHFTANTGPGWENPYWTNAIDPDGNFFDEQGKAKFRTPHAVNFAENNKAPDGHIYLSAHGYSSGKGRNNWDKGDAIYLCRTEAKTESIIHAGSYEFFAGHDATGMALWKGNVDQAEPILDWPNHLGSEGITYFPELDKYILITCRLKEGEDNLPYNVTIFWEADRITGPYKIIHYMRNWGPQAYFPNIPSQWINAGGQSAWMTVACNYSVPKYDPHQCRYAASIHEIRLVKKKGFEKKKYTGRNIAPEAAVSATSHEPESLPETTIDGIVDTTNEDVAKEWISQEGEGAILRLEWDEPKTIGRIRVFDSPAHDRWTKEGYVVFSDGTMEWMYAAPANGAGKPAEIQFAPKTVQWIRFTITEGVDNASKTNNTETTEKLGISEIQVFETK